MYASAFASPQLKQRIEHIWSNDGPGFMQEVLDSDEYKAVRNRITMIMPGASVVGVLLESDCETKVIESSAFGPKQHEGLSWLVMGGSFIPAKDSSHGSKQVDETVESIIKVMSLEQRREFIEAVFAAVYKTGADTLQELISDGLKLQTISSILSSQEMEPETKEQFMRGLLLAFHVDERIINFLFSRNKSSAEEDNREKEPAEMKS